MLYLTFTMISSVDLARYGVLRAKDLGIWELWYNFKLDVFILRGLPLCSETQV